VRHVLGLDPPFLTLDVVLVAGERFDRADRHLPGLVHRVQVGEDRRDARSRDEPRQVEPVRADVGHGAQRPALLRIETPVPVGWLQQPVLDVDAVDAVNGAGLAAANARPCFAAEGVEPDVVVGAVDESACLGETQQLCRFLRRERERLLADDVLAGRQTALACG